MLNDFRATVVINEQAQGQQQTNTHTFQQTDKIHRNQNDPDDHILNHGQTGIGAHQPLKHKVDADEDQNTANHRLGHKAQQGCAEEQYRYCQPSRDQTDQARTRPTAMPQHRQTQSRESDNTACKSTKDIRQPARFQFMVEVNILPHHQLNPGNIQQH